MQTTVLPPCAWPGSSAADPLDEGSDVDLDGEAMEGGEEEPLEDDSEVEVDPVEDCKDFQQFAKGSTRLPSGFAFRQDPGFEKATSSPSPGPLHGKVSAAARGPAEPSPAPLLDDETNSGSLA